MIELYKNISEEILKLLDTDDIEDVRLIEEFKKRQKLIDSLNGLVLDEFRRVYNEEQIYKVDQTIRSMLGKKIIDVRKEIGEFKVNKTANSAYANMNKNNLNILYKKV